MRPHRRQPTRLRCPWDSPGKKTEVGCHFLLQCMKVKSESEVDQLCPTLSNPMDCSPPGSSVHGIFQARVLEWVAIAFSVSCAHLTLKLSIGVGCWTSASVRDSVVGHFCRGGSSFISPMGLSCWVYLDSSGTLLPVSSL